MSELLEGFIPYPAEVAEEYRRRGYWKGLTLGDHLDDWVRRYGERIALVAGEQRISYRELGERVERAASHLAALGIAPGDRIVVQLNNIPEFVYLSFALFKLGALPIMALVRWSSGRIAYACASCRSASGSSALSLRDMAKDP